jgi:hypothetical protein
VPWPVYSERFLVSGAPNVWRAYTVPAGKRAVVSCVTGMSIGSETAQLFLSTPTVTLLRFLILAGGNSVSLTMRLPFYAGETLQCMVNVSNATMTVSGYLFDSGGTTADEAPPSAEGTTPSDFLDVVVLPAAAELDAARS